MVRERLLYRSVHARDLWRWFNPISISVSVLSTVNLDHAALLGHPFGEHAVRCIHKRTLFHSIIRHLSPCKLFFVCVSDSRNVRISITVIEVPGSLMGIVCTCSARLGQCFCGLCYSILFWSLIGLCTDFSASTETNMNGARVELATVGGSQRVPKLLVWAHYRLPHGNCGALRVSRKRRCRCSPFLRPDLCRSHWRSSCRDGVLVLLVVHTCVASGEWECV